ncbi:MAG: hypothetical protein KAH17_07980 [Bacteroidales bacterium]|nr:hypothetical protein [Bacteroidales bacterium]
MVGALFIGILSSYFHEKLLRKEFLLRRTLEQEKRKTEAINSSLEDRVEERTRRLQEMNEQLIDAKSEAEKSDQLKSAFLANMSHEIRTPMNSILGFTEILSDDEIEKEQSHKYLSIIHSNSIRLLQIINDIIDISKIESGSVEISPTFFKPSKVIGEVLDLFGSIEMNPNGIEILSEYPKESDSEIFTDYTKLIQIIVNLSQNAVKYTPKGQVKIGYKREHKDSICFYVYDTGIGISEEDQKTIFNRFTQVNIDQKTPNKGVGLGLAITQANTNLIQGKIKLTSALGEGSHFEINLPMRYSSSADQSS